MPAYMISYDLRNIRNYDALIRQLRDWNCISPLRSVWLGQLTGTATAIRNHLLPLVDGDDGLIVLELPRGSEWATARVNEQADIWLQNNVRL